MLTVNYCNKKKDRFGKLLLNQDKEIVCSSQPRFCDYEHGRLFYNIFRSNGTFFRYYIHQYYQESLLVNEWLVYLLTYLFTYSMEQSPS